MNIRKSLGAACAALVLAGCADSDGQERPLADGTPVTVTPVRAGVIEEHERSIAPSEVRHRPVIAAEVSGRVQHVAVDVGDRVTEGVVLAKLDDAQHRLAAAAARADVAALAATLRQQQSQVDRIRRVGDGQYVSAADLEAAEARLESLRQEHAAAVNRHDEARRRLELSVIRAPVDGRIDARMVSEGDFLGTGDDVFRILPDSGGRVRLPFPERAGDRLAEGMPAVIRRLGQDGGPRVEGRVVRLRPSVSGSMTVTAVVEFDAPRHWNPGTMLEGRIRVTRREDALLVPSAAIVDRPGRKVVYVLPGDARSGIVEERVVTLGHRAADTTEVLEGVQLGERVVVEGAAYLSDGAAARL